MIDVFLSALLGTLTGNCLYYLIKVLGQQRLSRHASLKDYGILSVDIYNGNILNVWKSIYEEGKICICMKNSKNLIYLDDK